MTADGSGTIDTLACLSPGEREVLALLAEGHTAKSVATMTGLSVAAVNERLRAARRKTGIGSSRELARALRLQENRDEKIGLPAPAAATPSAPAPAIRQAGGRLTMPLLLIAALGAASVTLQPADAPAPPSPVVQPDPLLKGLVDPRNTVSDLHAKVRSEERDAAWATPTETMLRARYARIRPLDAAGLRVTCARTLCEVAGPLPKDLPLRQANRLMKDLQGNALNDDLARAGLKSEAQGFSESFVAYWVRTPS